MLFSIICPAFNSHKYISDCIKSVISQTFLDWQLIIVDDQSDDSTVEEASKFLFDSRISIFSIKHGGQTKARKYGLNKACGDYILFLDSDDCLESDTLEFLNNLITKCSYDIVSFEMKRFVDNIDLVSHSYDKKPICKLEKEQILDHYYGKNRTLSLCGNAVKKHLVLKGFNNIPEDLETLRMCEDSVAIFEIIFLCSTALVINYPFYFYRTNPLSVSHIKKNTDRLDITLAYNHMYEKYTNGGKQKVTITSDIRKFLAYRPITLVLNERNSKRKIFYFTRKMFLFKEFSLKEKWNTQLLKALTFSLKYRFYFLFLILDKIYWKHNT